MTIHFHQPCDRSICAILVHFCLSITLGGLVHAAESPLDQLDEQFQHQIRPLMAQFCCKCHSFNEPEGEINLEKFTSLALVRRDRRTWQKVGEMLVKGEMPPPDARQPKAKDRQTLREWVRRYLAAEARHSAGDPGRVVMRRLTNVEYTNTIRDLTGIGLQPAREFPVDGAAGEGFTNTGDALVMSPALLTKYLDAAKEIAAHAVLLPDGFRFSQAMTRRDWTDELVGEIRRIYDRFADKDGKLPLRAYLSATIELRNAHNGEKALNIERFAAERGLSPKYLKSLWRFFHETQAENVHKSGIVDGLRARWQTAKLGDVPALAGEIQRWQGALWKFNPVGYAFSTPWQEPVDPVVGSVTLRQKIAPPAGACDVMVYLVVGDAGDGTSGDTFIWRRARVERAGQPPLLLRDLQTISRYLFAKRTEVLSLTQRYLAAAGEAKPGSKPAAVTSLAERHGLDADVLINWMDYLGLMAGAPAKINAYLQNRITKGGGYEFIQGWGDDATPNLVANSSNQEAHVPGLMKPHSVAVHPSPALRVAVGWRSPEAMRLRIEASVADAHAGCGNGITWSIELRRGAVARRLAAGTINDGQRASIAPSENFPVQQNDFVVLSIGPRDGNHGCDLTQIDLSVKSSGGEKRSWQLSRDVADDILAGNPHRDRYDNAGIWHFFTEPATAGDATKPLVPAGSLLAQWLDSENAEVKARLAEAIERLLTMAPAVVARPAPDQALYQQVTSLRGPVFGPLAAALPKPVDSRIDDTTAGPEKLDAASRFGVDPALFARRPDGKPIGPEDLCVQAPSVIEIRLPADLVEGGELVVDGELEPEIAGRGSVQPLLLSSRPNPTEGIVPGLPIVARAGSASRARIEAGLAEFRRLFPGALCFRQIVPVDEVITVIQFFRGDEPLDRLMLDNSQKDRLDRLWGELHFVSQDAIKIYQIFDQMLGFASQENQTAKVEGWRKPIAEQYEAFLKVVRASEPRQIEALLRWTARAYRRPLSSAEAGDLAALYQKLRQQQIGHEEAFRLVLARVLVAPAFLYRVEQPGAGTEAKPVSDWELASRLSYFLWASMPDQALLRLAGGGRLRDPNVLAAQARRMIGDGRARALAIEFACQWLEIRDFDKLDEKSERHFPTFAGVRSLLYEESVRFFLDLFQRDGSLLELIECDHAFLNEALARHYGIPGVTGPEWRRVDGVKRYGRGGVLGMGTILAKQSGASRTSPILRGNWLLETLLGERLPRPPKNVPRLPEDEAATDGLTMRQLVEKHRSAAQCAGCHERIDPLGFALERFDAIGRLRDKDFGDRPVDTHAVLKDGTQIDGVAGLRGYVLAQRKEEFLRNFCRKLLGYALGRAVQLSDEPLIAEMMGRLKSTGYRFSAAWETIIRSKPFRYHRGLIDDEAMQ
jgi:hypothetical protein